MPLFVNGVEIENVFVDGVEQDNVFVDGVEVFSSGSDHVLNVGFWLNTTYGYSLTFVAGSFTPNDFLGRQMSVVSFHVTGIITIQPSGAPPQYPGVNVIQMIVDGLHTVSLTWDGLGYTVTNTIVADYIAARRDQDVNLKLKVIS